MLLSGWSVIVRIRIRTRRPSLRTCCNRNTDRFPLPLSDLPSSLRPWKSPVLDGSTTRTVLQVNIVSLVAIPPSFVCIVTQLAARWQALSVAQYICVLNRFKCYMINLNVVSVNVIYIFQWIPSIKYNRMLEKEYLKIKNLLPLFL